MLSLIWKIGADMNPFRTAMKGVVDEAKKAGAAAGSAMGSTMGAQIKSTLMGVIGLGALKSMLLQGVREAEQVIQNATKLGTSVERSQEIDRVASITGLSPEQVKLGIEQDPGKFRELATALARGNPVMSTRAVNQFAELGRTGFVPMTKAALAEAATASLAYAEAHGGSTMRLAGRMTGSKSLERFGSELVGAGIRRADKYYGAGDPSALPPYIQSAKDFRQAAARGQFMQDNGESMLQILRLIHDKL